MLLKGFEDTFGDVCLKCFFVLHVEHVGLGAHADRKDVALGDLVDHQPVGLVEVRKAGRRECAFNNATRQRDVFAEADEEIELDEHVEGPPVSRGNSVCEELVVGDGDDVVVEGHEPNRAQTDRGHLAVGAVEGDAVADLERSIEDDRDPGNDRRREILEREANRDRGGAGQRDHDLFAEVQ